MNNRENETEDSKPKSDGYKPSDFSDLLDCPFCGSPGSLVWRSDKHEPEEQLWNAGCSKMACIAYRPNLWQYDKQRVIDGWNHNRWNYGAT